jgi:hypothetical protein
MKQSVYQPKAEAGLSGGRQPRIAQRGEQALKGKATS